MGEHPAAWLVAHAHLLPAAGQALDVAAGSGRNALWLAQRGWQVDAVDRDEDAVAELASAAQRLRLAVHPQRLDLETVPPPSLGSGAYDLIVVFNYLHRPLFPALFHALAPGGVLVYETFTRAQALRGRPTNPAFLLEPGELRAVTRGSLAILASREGEFEGRSVASIVARHERQGAPGGSGGLAGSSG